MQMCKLISPKVSVHVSILLWIFILSTLFILVWNLFLPVLTVKAINSTKFNQVCKAHFMSQITTMIIKGGTTFINLWKLYAFIDLQCKCHMGVTWQLWNPSMTTKWNIILHVWCKIQITIITTRQREWRPNLSKSAANCRACSAVWNRMSARFSSVFNWTFCHTHHTLF